MVLSKQTGSKGIGMLMKEYTSAELASQRIDYWTGEAHRRVVGPSDRTSLWRASPSLTETRSAPNRERAVRGLVVPSAATTMGW